MASESYISRASGFSIAGCVGQRGANRSDDVLIVQKLLNRAVAGSKEDGDCGRATISAIEEYNATGPGILTDESMLTPCHGGTWLKGD